MSPYLSRLILIASITLAGCASAEPDYPRSPYARQPDRLGEASRDVGSIERMVNSVWRIGRTVTGSSRY